MESHQKKVVLFEDMLLTVHVLVKVIIFFFLNIMLENLEMPRKVVNAKIACIDFSLQKRKMHLGISVVVEDPQKLEAIRKEYFFNF